MKALAYPFHIDVNGHLASVDSYAEVIRGQLIDVLMTNYAERVMRPTYGADMQRALFDPTDELVRSDAARQVFTRIENFAPRVVLKSVQFNNDNSRPGVLYVDVIYQAGAFSEAQALRIPLPVYLSEETAV